MDDKRAVEPHEAATPFGQMPGMNGNVVGPSFRDGPRQKPDAHPVRSLLMGLVPVVVIVAVLLLTGRI